MEAVRHIKKIESGEITITNLDKFKGKNVEIIILPFIDENNEIKSITNLFGAMNSKIDGLEFQNKIRSEWI